jgi:predicted permease
MLFGAVGVLFLIAASSLASLVLARAAARVPDIVLRRSLGATGWRLIRVWLLEGLVLAVPGILLGAWVAVGVLRVARGAIPEGMIPGLGTTNAVFVWSTAGVLLAITTVLFAIAPAIAGVLRASATSSTQGSQVAGLRRVRAQNLLIAGQVSLSVVLVSASLWLALGLFRTLSRPVGFEPDGLVMVNVSSTRDSTRDADVVRSARDRFAARFGADRAAAASGMPGVNAAHVRTLRIRPEQDVLPEDARPSLVRFLVSPNYFSLLGIPILEGRAFAADDERNPGRTIVVSRAFAARWFPEGALGRDVSFGRDDRRTIIGVADDVHAGTVASDANEPAFYLSATDNFLAGAIDTYLLRTTRSIADVRAEAQQIFRDLDPSASLMVLTARGAMAYPLAPRITAQRAVVALALVALALAVVNVYALSAFSVVQRAREIGIRIALGATSTDTVRLVMRRAVLWTTCGLATGAAATVGLVGPALRAQLASLPTDEPWLLAVAFITVSGIAMLASWLPARRATTIDPAVTLRAE